MLLSLVARQEQFSGAGKQGTRCKSGTAPPLCSDVFRDRVPREREQLSSGHWFRPECDLGRCREGIS
jgi:hypothetical protein